MKTHFSNELNRQIHLATFGNNGRHSEWGASGSTANSILCSRPSNWPINKFKTLLTFLHFGSKFFYCHKQSFNRLIHPAPIHPPHPHSKAFQLMKILTYKNNCTPRPLAPQPPLRIGFTNIIILKAFFKVTPFFLNYVKQIIFYSPQ